MEDGLTLERVRAEDARRNAPSGGRDYYAGYRSDGIGGVDLLGITDEVEADRDPPGFADPRASFRARAFGDWGTGKTFFMSKFQERIRGKAVHEAGKKPDNGKQPMASYCKSMVYFSSTHGTTSTKSCGPASDAIFEGLDEAVKTRALMSSGIETRAEKRVRLLAEQAANRTLLEAARRATADAQDAVREASEQLVALDLPTMRSRDRLV